MSLSDREAMFVREYLIDANAHRAALRAGYREKAAKCDIARKPKIRRAIRLAQAARAERQGITAARVLLEYARIAFADMNDFVEAEGGGRRLKPLAAMPPGRSAALRFLWARGGGTTGRTRASIHVQLHDKTRALRALARHLGLETPARVAVVPAGAEAEPGLTEDTEAAGR